MTRRGVVFALGAIALVAYGCLATAVWRAKSRPEEFRGWGSLGWIVGPPAKALLHAADARIEQALAALNDGSKSPAERLAGHRANLKAAEDLLIRSLKAEPAQPAALARLAAVRWELDPPIEDQAVRRGLDLIDLAAQLAPEAPRVRLQLGELLLQAGRTADALPHLRRAVELDPGSAERAIGALRARWVPATEIAESLPVSPEVLVALEPAFLQDGSALDYMTKVEPFLETGPAALVESYGDAALSAKEARRLADTMQRLSGGDASQAAERKLQWARGLSALGEAPAAVATARAACEAAPADARVIERAGRIALEAKDPAAALDAFRTALALAARAGSSRVRRATLYRQIGQAEDALGHPDRAYTAYLHALRLEPREGHAKRRVEQLEKAAGVSR